MLLKGSVMFQSLFWVRLLSHLICGLLIGSIYFDIGNDAAKVINNSSCLIFAVLFLMFTAMMPTITTCKSLNFLRTVIV